MGLKNLGGALQPRQHNGEAVDACYGVDASGKYLGVVPVTQAAARAIGAPPELGEWRWDGQAWQPYKSREERAAQMELDRDARIDAGVSWSGRVWYADPMFQQQLAAYMQAFTEGILPEGSTVDIRSRDKVVYQLGREELRELSAAVLMFVQAEFAKCWALKAAIQE
jgi:hypothetical protein